MNFSTLHLLILCFATWNVFFPCFSGDLINKFGNNESYLLNFDSTGNFQPGKSSCESLIIFDLSKIIVTKEIFDVSINLFLKYVLQYCNDFKFVVMDDNINRNCKSLKECNFSINECDGSKGCKEIIDNLDYSNITNSYSADLTDNNSNDARNFAEFLNKIFAEISSHSSVILLTNRIVFIEANSISQIIEDSSIKLMTILLGKNETSAMELLEQVYENIPNSQALNFPNYDCLSYLFYCLIPCSTDKPGCMQEDIDDCQVPTTDQTLHIWYVLDFIYNPLDWWVVRRNMVSGLRNYTETNNIKKVRIRFVCADNITLSSEDINSPNDFAYIFEVLQGAVIDNDENYLNDLLSLTPWNDTLTETRIGILAVIILTNYATKNLITEKDGQHLQSQMYIYNPVSYEYYSGTFKNDTNLHLSFLTNDDVVPVLPIRNSDTATTFSTLTPTSSSTSSSTSPITTRSTEKTTSIILATTEQTNKSKISPRSATTTIIIIIIPGLICGIFITCFIVIYCKRKRRISREVPKRSPRKETPALHQDDWELTWDKLIIKNEIGAGAFGQIYLGKLRNYNDTGDDVSDVAIKMPGKLATDLTKIPFLNEIDLMKKISRNFNIIKMLGCITIGDRVCLVLEYCANLDLLSYVKKIKSEIAIDEGKKCIQIEFYKFLWQMSHGLEYLASKKIIHRDLAARNILIDSNKNAKITDFGLSIQLRDKTYIIPSRETEKLPIKWLAIESFISYKFSLKTDIWTFGIVLYEMYSFGETPYADVEASELLQHLEAGNRLQKPDFCSEEIFEIMLKCWMENPFNRPKIDELIASFSMLVKHSITDYGFMDL